MRTIVDLPAEQIKALDGYRKKEGISRAEAVRRAVASFLPARPAKRFDYRNHPAFGSSRDERTGDSTETVRTLREEMGTVIACIDSDVLIDFFDGIEEAADELSRYDALMVSRITWMEVLIGAKSETSRATRENLLRSMTIIELDERVAREAITLRQTHRLKLPDAIIWASARLNEALLVTRNTKDFPAGEPGVRTPYKPRD